MKTTQHPRIKICCISSKDEAKLAIEFGASALGFVGQMPSGPGVIPDSRIREIVSSVPPSIATFLLTAETEAEEIVRHYKKVNTTTIQLVDAVSETTYEFIRSRLPHVKIVQVIHVIDRNSVEQALHAAAFADALLLDSGNPNLTIKELGGTGRIHDWNLSSEIRRSVDVPIFLAGGLNAANVQHAIQRVSPFGLDLCSGVRANGNLCPVKIKSFFETI